MRRAIALRRVYECGRNVSVGARRVRIGAVGSILAVMALAAVAAAPAREAGRSVGAAAPKATARAADGKLGTATPYGQQQATAALRNPDLARTYRSIARQGTDALYGGRSDRTWSPPSTTCRLRPVRPSRRGPAR